VICFSPRHDLTIAKMSEREVLAVVNLWKEQTKELSEIDFINHIQIFENRGEMMGCSNPHPHGQIWAEKNIPNESAKEIAHQKQYWEKHHSSLLMDYLEKEKEKKERIVLENDSFTALVPYWAVWPFETMILPNRPMQSLLDASEKEKEDLARIVRLLSIKYDNLFEVSFPYSMGLHQAPSDGRDHPYYQFHLHYYPPLLRSATIKKFMVGYELLAMAQRDITSEMSAARLREMSSTHYRENRS
jgi:UDPglucose--hexose-1-phosphate uridylyltransferase